MNRAQLIQIAEDTINILNSGKYFNSKRQLVNIKELVDKSIKESILIEPTEDLKSKLSQLKAAGRVEDNKEGIIEVANETTLAGAKRLLDQGYKKVACLNFASAKNPGGGFLNGASAQEESLARSSALYPCIVQMEKMYEYNKKIKTCLYSDYMIFSPDVPVIKDDVGNLLDEPYLVSFITAPAVNAGIVQQREGKENIQKIPQVMLNRIEKILILGILQGCDAIVLGAYGCGVFRNSPQNVAQYFNTLLNEEAAYKKYYKKVLFSVFDRSSSQENYKAFLDLFSN
ncbi:MAG: TIGR02452 family protein [Clostridiales bacterium]|nr:TIGR02452 family protein [Clostridiales bacterium]